MGQVKAVLPGSNIMYVPLDVPGSQTPGDWKLCSTNCGISIQVMAPSFRRHGSRRVLADSVHVVPAL